MDNKLKTFLTVCQTMNYRKAAQLLHLTQPAVTKQIHALEGILGTTLFSYDGHLLHKTESCRLFEQYAIGQRYNYEEVLLAIRRQKRTRLRIGATKTIGDYLLGPALIRFLKEPEHELSLVVSNTESLLELLDQNELDFAIIEGTFQKAKYDYTVYLDEPFVGACSADSPLCGRRVTVEDLLKEPLIVRECGSGTRNILESSLGICGFQLNDFEKVVSISSFAAIRQLISAGMGITFLYQAVIQGEPSIGSFQVAGITMPHTFHFVYPKNSAAGKYAQLFLPRLGHGQPQNQL